ncbi:MAG: SPOR domain-containing protein [Chitinophagales bacterium]|nr:SPOR domain-containing protein [Chitinophagales bacterium]
MKKSLQSPHVYAFTEWYRFMYSMTILGTILLLLLTTSNVIAQGNIEIIQDSRVETLISRYAQVKQKQASIEGYRIQISAGSNRNNVYQTKSQFYQNFSDIKQYIIYQSPNFKLRVGNYRTRLEAYKDLQEILPRFNGAFIIRDEIKISEL